MKWCLMVDFLLFNIVALFPLPCSLHIPLSQQSPHCCPCPWVLFPFLFNPSTPSPPLLNCHLLSIYESVPIFLVSSVCSLDSTYYEIIWYLFFSDWLISLSIMFLRSIHTVAKGKFSFLWLSSVPLCKYSIVVLSTHLLMNIWAVFISWWL